MITHVSRDNNVLFQQYIKRLESHECCQKLSLQSFLLLPMQRITRMPLLILNILNHVPVQTKDRQIVEDALKTTQSVSKFMITCISIASYFSIGKH